MTDTKKTKLDYLNAIKDALLPADSEVEEMDPEYADLIDFVNKEILIEENNRARAKERAAAKKAADEPLKNLVLSLLTEEYQTIEEITSQIDDANITKAKVTSRLNQLYKEGKALKTMVKVDTRNLTAYKAIV